MRHVITPLQGLTSVGGRVVVAKDLKARLAVLADGHLGKEREEVARLTPGVLADEAGGVGAGGAEVREDREVKVDVSL